MASPLERYTFLWKHSYISQIHDHVRETRLNMQDLVARTLREDFESKIKENKKNCLFQLQVI